MIGVLVKRELISLLCSAYCFFFAFVFLIVNGLMLWLFSGSFNILDNGYATLERFFALSSMLFVVLIPALTMRSFSEEKHTNTLLLQYIRPISLSQLFFSKFIAILIVLLLVLVSTIVYIYTLYVLGSPVGNLDINVVVISYFSLIGIGAVFVAVGVFASSLSKYQIVGFIVGLLVNSILFWGFDLFASLFTSGIIYTLVRSFGLISHFEQMQRGVVQSVDILVFINYVFLFWVLTILVINPRKFEIAKAKTILGVVVALILVNVVNSIITIPSFDFTKDNRYTIRDYSKKILEETSQKNNSDIQINVYLGGDLNYSFLRLKDATRDLLSDFNKYANHRLSVSFIDPSSLSMSRDKLPSYMSERGLPPITLAEKDRDGKVSQQLIYPYAEIISNQDTLQVSLLKNTLGNTAEQNLNASIENLEFEFVDALRLLGQEEPIEIAFIEGHDELARPYVFDAEDVLSKYFFVNRGEIGTDISILDNFRVIIIAGPRERFSEVEKYILDQYIMKGGRVLWLIDGVYVSEQDLKNKGQSASMKNETNLDDLLFAYGLRVNPELIQDAQCTDILVQVGEGRDPSVVIPWYYSPLLLPSQNNPITDGIADVKASFVSEIDLLRASQKLDAHILLTSTDKSHLVKVPDMIDFDVEHIQANKNYFDQSFLPTAVSLQGEFSSAFTNRMVPDSVKINTYKTKNVSSNTKMILVSSSDVIRNEIIGQGDKTQVIPMGYDRVSDHQYGNKNFIVNAVNWLANDDEWLSLRDNKRQIDLLNKQLIYENRNLYVILNTVFPIVFVVLILGSVIVRRRYKYRKI